MKKLNAGRPLLTWATIVTVLATAGSILSGCSLKPVDQHVIRVELPSSEVQKLQANRLHSVAGIQAAGVESSVAVPASRSEFKCFAINVTGPEIPPHPKFQCKDPAESIGILAGFFSVNHEGGTEMQVTVPSGLDRRVQIIALTSASGRCGSVDNDSDMDDTGEPFIVGQAVVNVVGDTSVEIEAAYDPATAKPAFRSCDGGGSGSSTQDGFVPIAAAVKGFASRSEEGVASPVDLVNPSALTSAELAAIANFDGSIEPLPEISTENSAIFKSSRYIDVAEDVKFPAIQLRWDVSNLNSSVIDLQLQIGFDLVGAGCGGVKGLQAVLLTDSGAKLGHFLYYDLTNHSRNLRWNPFYRTFSDHTLTVDGKRMVVLNVYAQFDDYGGGCEAEVAIGAAHLRVPLQTPPLQLNYGEDVLVAGRAHHLGAYGGLPPYDFQSSVSGPISQGVLHAEFIAGSGSEETITVFDSAKASAAKTFGLARFKTRGSSAFVPGCNSDPIFFEMELAGFPYAPKEDERIGLLSPGGFFVEFYETSNCLAGTQIWSATIPAGASSSQSVYVKIIAGFGNYFEISGFADRGGVVDALGISYSDASCMAPAGVAFQSSAGGSTPCNSQQKAQSFVPGENMKLASISLRNAIEMWPGGTSPSSVNVKVYADNSGQPGTVIANGASSCIAPTGFFDSECIATFSGLPTLTKDVKYWIVIWHPTSAQFCWQGSSGDSYSSGEAKVFTGTSWIVAPVSDFMFQINACGI